jgi:iron complex outermembrane receptor protein
VAQAATELPAHGSDEPLAEVAESLTVTDTRLRDRPEEKRWIPAHITVIDEEAIAASGADTVQELVSGVAGVVSYDQVGNDLSRVLDLRGFTGGGLKVFLDGVPLNEPRNNSLQLELVPLSSLGRVEITRGSSAAQAGGGAEAGVINLWTRKARGRGGRLSLSAGDLATAQFGGSAWVGSERGDLLVSASRLETDGHRENAASDLTRLAVVGGWNLGSERRLQLSVLRGAGDFGNPGALTGAELAADREQAPFNALDFTDETSLQAVVGLEAQWRNGASLIANHYRRERTAGVLTTGRSAPTFGGFFTDSETSIDGSTLQVAWGWQGSHDLTAGLELLDGATDAAGLSTPPADLGRVDPAGLSSDNTAKRQTRALYLQDTWSPASAWAFSAGLRFDDDEVGYEERSPDPANDASRTYSELSLRAGVVWAPATSWELYATYGEAFLPPTVEELFSFPQFGSNPDLDPEDSSSLEIGLRRRWRDASLDAALFRIDTVDEIVFDPASLVSPFGANVNAGETRRQGLELVAEARPSQTLHLFASLTVTDAEFSGGENRGRSVPLVPEERLAAGLDLTLAAGVELGGRVLHVGEQVLDGDEANARAPLAAYTVLDVCLKWRPGATSASAGGRRPRLFVEASNLLDEEYSTRGIFAFDFSTFENTVFYSPAPGRRWRAGVEWVF